MKTKTFYEICLYDRGQLVDYADRQESLQDAIAIAKELSFKWDEVGIGKEIGEDGDYVRVWTKFYQNGKLVRTEV